METQPPREYKDIRINVPWGHVVGRWYGNTQVRPILALHGWLDNMGTWDTLIPLMPQHIGILCIDFPGHGRSSRFPNGIAYHTVYDYTDIIIRIMKEYKWKKVSLMGHSMGAIVSFVYASIYPHTVDMIIAIDVIKPPYRPIDVQISRLRRNPDMILIEDERYDALAQHEPPSYTYEELERILTKGTADSVNIENAKYLLNRSIVKSTKYMDKYYFSRDGKTKFYFQYNPAPGMVEEMARRIHNVAYFVAKASNSNHIRDDSKPVIKILRQQNPHFEIHTIAGTHHLHLNNSKELALLLNPFIYRHRPVGVNAWSLVDVGDKVQQGLWKTKAVAKQKNKVKSKL